MHPAAKQELIDASQYYQEQVDGLGHSFLDAALEAVDRIRAFPQLAEEIRPGVRRLPLQRFPYSLHYRVLANSVEIVSVAHQKRKPGYWSDRL